MRPDYQPFTPMVREQPDFLKDDSCPGCDAGAHGVLFPRAGGLDSMRKTKKRVNADILRIVKRFGGKKATRLFRELSTIGGNNFRRAMRRIHRIIKKK
jgi:hypothetical protein